MAKEVIICTTKPELDQFEYAIENNGVLELHGEVVSYDLSTLPAQAQAAISAARAVIQAAAEADATAKGLL